MKGTIKKGLESQSAILTMIIAFNKLSCECLACFVDMMR